MAAEDGGPMVPSRKGLRGSGAHGRNPRVKYGICGRPRLVFDTNVMVSGSSLFMANTDSG